jgi:E3 ubiquitin-protein ligase NEDD4
MLFCSAVIEYRVHKRVKEQFDAFMAGFSELIPQDLINVFDERELEVRTPLEMPRLSD